MTHCFPSRGSSDLAAVSYVAAAAILRGCRVCGVRLHDAVAGTTRDIGATLVINATGAGADRLAAAPDGAPALRPLRGSHLVFSRQQLPLTHTVTWLHPQDGRPVFACPWEDRKSKRLNSSH